MLMYFTFGFSLYLSTLLCSTSTGRFFYLFPYSIFFLSGLSTSPSLFRHFFVSISSYCLHLHLRLDITEKFLASTYLLYFFRSHSTRYFPVFSFFVLFSIVLSRCYSKPVKPQCPLPPLASCSVPLPFRCPGSPSAPLAFKQREQ